MKKIFLMLFCAGALLSCDKYKEFAAKAGEATSGKLAAEKIDYQMFSKPDEVKKWYDAVKERLGANAKVTDEVRFGIYRPSVEGMIKREGEADNLDVSVVYQDNVDKRRVQEIKYYSDHGGWQPAETKEIQVMGIGSEDFKLEDELFDFNELSAANLQKIVADAMAKYKNEAKFDYQYISSIDITKDNVQVKIYGILKSNAQEKSEYYKADFNANPVD